MNIHSNFHLRVHTYMDETMSITVTGEIHESIELQTHQTIGLEPSGVLERDSHERHGALHFVTGQESPDGGWRAYLILLGAWCALLPPSGLLNSFGTFQAYLGTHQLQEYSDQQIGWIFSVYAFLFVFGSAQVGMLSLVRCLRRGRIKAS